MAKSFGQPFGPTIKNIDQILLTSFLMKLIY